MDHIIKRISSELKNSEEFLDFIVLLVNRPLLKDGSTAKKNANDCLKKQTQTITHKVIELFENLEAEASQLAHQISKTFVHNVKNQHWDQNSIFLVVKELIHILELELAHDSSIMAKILYFCLNNENISENRRNSGLGPLAHSLIPIDCHDLGEDGMNYEIQNFLKEKLEGYKNSMRWSNIRQQLSYRQFSNDYYPSAHFMVTASLVGGAIFFFIRFLLLPLSLYSGALFNDFGLLIIVYLVSASVYLAFHLYSSYQEKNKFQRLFMQTKGNLHEFMFDAIFQVQGTSLTNEIQKAVQKPLRPLFIAKSKTPRIKPNARPKAVAAPARALTITTGSSQSFFASPAVNQTSKIKEYPQNTSTRKRAFGKKKPSSINQKEPFYITFSDDLPVYYVDNLSGSIDEELKEKNLNNGFKVFNPSRTHVAYFDPSIFKDFRLQDKFKKIFNGMPENLVRPRGESGLKAEGRQKIGRCVALKDCASKVRIYGVLGDEKFTRELPNGQIRNYTLLHLNKFIGKH